MKKLIILMIFAAISNCTLAQDVIVLRDGTNIVCKMQKKSSEIEKILQNAEDVDKVEIEYWLPENNGASQKKSCKNISFIMYRNGDAIVVVGRRNSSTKDIRQYESHSERSGRGARDENANRGNTHDMERLFGTNR